MIDRIVIVNDLAHPKGGASQLAVESAVEFVRRGHSVTLLCGGDDNPALAVQGVDVVALGQQRLLAANPLTTMVRGLYNGRARHMVARWIAQNDSPRTIYHVHGWSQILSPALFAALRPVRRRLLMHAHDFFLTCPNGAMFDYGTHAPCPLTPMSRACVTTACDRRGRVSKAWRVARQGVQDRLMATGAMPPQLLIHSGMTEYFARSGLTGSDMVVLPNPVEPFVATRIAAEHNRDVLFVGRIEATKGIDLAAEACRRADLRLVAVGDGDLLPGLRARYPEMVWTGRKSHAEIGALASSARLAVMPSRHIEPFGLAAVEALWSGLPVLSSAQSLIAPQIAAAGAGASIDPLDTDGFAAALRELAADDPATRRMSERAFGATGHLALSPARWIDALLAAYAALLDGGRPGLLAAAHRWAPVAERATEPLTELWPTPAMGAI
ncbi:MAG: hypothetical protein RLZZ08_131 [Pseudomonadota bacterium]|jgi:glycosyltransferase involved in cell wall biosynthesis